MSKEAGLGHATAFGKESSCMHRHEHIRIHVHAFVYIRIHRYMRISYRFMCFRPSVHSCTTVGMVHDHMYVWPHVSTYVSIYVPSHLQQYQRHRENTITASWPWYHQHLHDRYHRRQHRPPPHHEDCHHYHHRRRHRRHHHNHHRGCFGVFVLVNGSVKGKWRRGMCCFMFRHHTISLMLLRGAATDCAVNSAGNPFWPADISGIYTLETASETRHPRSMLWEFRVCVYVWGLKVYYLRRNFCEFEFRDFVFHDFEALFWTETPYCATRHRLRKVQGFSM